MPEGEDGQPPERAAGEDVQEAEDRAGRRLEEGADRMRVDAGRRNVRAQPIHGQHQEREEDPLAQVRHVEDVGEALEGAQRDSTSQRPPAASIPALAEAENLCAETVRAFCILPSPRILTGPVLAGQPQRRERLRRDRGAGLEAIEVAEVHDVVLDPKDVGEAALGQPPVERHLAALEASLVPVAGPRLLSLVAAARGLAVAASRAAADALAVVGRADRRRQIVDAGGGRPGRRLGRLPDRTRGLGRATRGRSRGRRRLGRGLGRGGLGRLLGGRRRLLRRRRSFFLLFDHVFDR